MADKLFPWTEIVPEIEAEDDYIWSCVETEITELPDLVSWCFPGQFRSLCRIHFDLYSYIRTQFHSRPIIGFGIDSDGNAERQFAVSFADVGHDISAHMPDARYFAQTAIISTDIVSDANAEREIASQGDVTFDMSANMPDERYFASQADIVSDVTDPAFQRLRDFVSQADIASAISSYMPDERYFAQTAAIVSGISDPAFERTWEFASTADIVSGISDPALAGAVIERQFTSQADIVSGITDPAINAEREFASTADIVSNITDPVFERLRDFVSQADIVSVITDPVFERTWTFASQADILFDITDPATEPGEGDPAYEDLRTFIEDDTENDLTVTEFEVAFDTMRRDSTALLYKDFGVDFFAGDFNIEYEFEITASDTSSNFCILALANIAAATFQEIITDNEAITCGIQNNGNLQFAVNDQKTDNSDTYQTSSDTILTWFTLARTGTTVTLKMYSDSERQTLIDTMTIYDAVDNYRYLYMPTARDIGTVPERSMTGTIQNLSKQETFFAEISYTPASDYPSATDGNVSMLQMPFDTYITVPNHSSLNPTGAITLEWRGIIDETAAGNQMVIEKPFTTHNDPYYQYLLSYRTDTKVIRMDLVIGGTRYTALSDAEMEVVVGQRLHICGTYDGSDMKLYLNGRLVAEEPVSGAINAYGQQLLFGKHGNIATEKSDATFDEVRIWSVARTQAEITLNMERQLIGVESGLEGLWLFNEDTGVSISDATANSNDGTVNGSYTWNSTIFTWDGVSDEKWHIPSRLNLPTYDGSGNSVHPSVVYIPAGLSGYNWWMGITPYPGLGDASYENPSILASNDGIEWEVPGGASNPIVPGDAGVIFNSDSNLLAIDNNGVTELFYYYRETIISGDLIDIKLIKSDDGINWGDPVIVWPEDGDNPMSPAVFHNGDEFIMIASDFDVAIRRWTSPNGIDWTPAAAAAVSGLPGGRYIWHFDIIYDTEIDRLHIFMTLSTGAGGAESRTAYAYSDDDGENITVVDYLTADLTNIELLQYQGSMVLDPDYKDRYWVFGSSYGGLTGEWYTTLITRRLSSGDLYQENGQLQPYEDLTNFIEIDTENDLTVTQFEVAFDTMRRDSTSLLYKDFGIDNFTDFHIEYEIEITDSENIVESANFCPLALSNIAAATYQDIIEDNEGITCQVQNNGSLQFGLKDQKTDNSDTYQTITGETIPLTFFTLARTGTTVTLKMYSDSERTILVDTMTIPDAVDNYRYLYMPTARDIGTGSEIMTGKLQNLSKQPFTIFQNLTEFTLVDEDGDLTAYADYIEIDTLRRDARTYAYKDFGVDYFGDFEIECEGTFTVSDTYGSDTIACVSNQLGTFNDMLVADDGILFYFYDYGSTEGGDTAIRLYDCSNDDNDVFILPGNYGTWYFTFSRVGTTTTLKIYSDVDRETLISTLSVTGDSGKKQYFFCAGAREYSILYPEASVTSVHSNYHIT